ncbi:hypothetical protein EPO66_00155 [bacterium]|nr:MAG: hypothetical protein EPO66_00155 [bacterium]
MQGIWMTVICVIVLVMGVTIGFSVFEFFHNLNKHLRGEKPTSNYSRDWKIASFMICVTLIILMDKADMASNKFDDSLALSIYRGILKVAWYWDNFTVAFIVALLLFFGLVLVVIGYCKLNKKISDYERQMGDKE